MNTVTICFNGENAHNEALAFMYVFVKKLGNDSTLDNTEY